MKIISMLAAAAAALLAIPAVSAAPAPAPIHAAVAVEAAPIQSSVRERRERQVVRHHRERRVHRGYERRRHVSYRRVCKTNWRHGQRVRSCRRVRTYR